MVLAHKIQDEERTRDIQISVDVTFGSMLLSNKVLEGLKNSGFYKPSPIQLHGIPLGKCGFDLILEAKSGTGKTAVFTIIALEQLQLDKGLQSVILAPTREIAAQVKDVIKQIGSSYKGLNVQVVMGGLSVADDIQKFQKNVHILVGSPGRLRHLIQDKHVNVSYVRLLVLDEADKLIDKSFQPDINYIFAALPKQKQVVLSSATYPDISILQNYVKKAQHICPDSTSILLGIKQLVTIVESNVNIVSQTKNKFQELLRILTREEFKQCLIFCSYQVRVGELCNMLKREKWPAEQLHGQLEQIDRLDALRTLQEYKCRILVSTDLAARGIDASNVDLVINFEPPFEWQTYLHRIGRAGRFGSYGIAVTILSKGKEVSKFKETMKSLGSSLNMRYLWNDEMFEFNDTNLNNDLDKTIELQKLETPEVKEIHETSTEIKTPEMQEKIKTSNIISTCIQQIEKHNMASEVPNEKATTLGIVDLSDSETLIAAKHCTFIKLENAIPTLKTVTSNTPEKDIHGRSQINYISNSKHIKRHGRTQQETEEDDTDEELLDISKYKQINYIDDIQTAVKLPNSFEKSKCKIESFDELMTSFKEYEPNNNETDDIDNVIEKKLKGEVVPSIVMTSNSYAEHEEKKHIEDKDILETSIAHNLGNKEYSKSLCERHIKLNSPSEINSLSQDQIDNIASLDSYQKALQDAGLPTSFGSTKHCNRVLVNQDKPLKRYESLANKLKSHNRYMNDNNKNNSQIINNKVNEINNKSEASTSLDDDGYNTHSGLFSRSTKYVSSHKNQCDYSKINVLYGPSNMSLSKVELTCDIDRKYKAWFKQLKTYIQQVEMSLYIDELSKELC